MKLRLLQLLLSSAFILSIAGCSVRGYSGPVRPAGEVSTVTLHKVGEVSIEHQVFDDHDITALSDNVELLSGSHDFRLYFRIESKENCQPSDLFCIATEIKGVCEGHLNTLAGRTYLVTVENKYSLVDIHVAAKGYFDFSERSDEANPGAGSCRTGSTSDFIY